MIFQRPLAHLFCVRFVPLISIFSALFAFECSVIGETKSDPTDNLRASCFDVATDNRNVHLLFGRSETNSKALNLYWQQTKDAGQNWSHATLIPTAHAVPGEHHHGNDPQIAARGNRLMALWTAKGGGPYGSGHIATTLSDDGGKTWRPGPSPVASNRDDVGYRFPATAADERGFHVIWIHAEDKERSLRYARLDFGAKKWSKPIVIDSTSCACCWNELKVGNDGKLFALYRDEEPKDMALAVSQNGGRSWKQKAHVGEFDWHLNGCPHVGGGLALAKDEATGKNALFATVWSGQVEHTGAYSLVSNDGGQSWSGLTKLGMLGDTGRHTDVAALSGANAAVVWDQHTEDEQTVHLMTTSDGGKNWNAARQLSSSHQKASYPRIVAVDGKFLAFWSENLDDPRIHIETIGVDVAAFHKNDH